MVAHKIVHVRGLLVELPVQLVLLGGQFVQLLGEGVGLLGVGFGELLLQFLSVLTELFLLLDQGLQIVVEFGVFGLGVRDVGLFAQEIIVILDADDLQADGLAARQMGLRRGVQRLGKEGDLVAGLEAEFGEVEISRSRGCRGRCWCTVKTVGRGKTPFRPRWRRTSRRP